MQLSGRLTNSISVESRTSARPERATFKSLKAFLGLLTEMFSKLRTSRRLAVQVANRMAECGQTRVGSSC